MGDNLKRVENSILDIQKFVISATMRYYVDKAVPEDSYRESMEKSTEELTRLKKLRDGLSQRRSSDEIGKLKDLDAKKRKLILPSNISEYDVEKDGEPLKKRQRSEMKDSQRKLMERSGSTNKMSRLTSDQSSSKTVPFSHEVSPRMQPNSSIRFETRIEESLCRLDALVFKELKVALFLETPPEEVIKDFIILSDGINTKENLGVLTQLARRVRKFPDENAVQHWINWMKYLTGYSKEKGILSIAKRLKTERPKMNRQDEE